MRVMRVLCWLGPSLTAALRAPRPSRVPQLRAVAVETPNARALDVAESKDDLATAAELCEVAFPPSTKAEHLKVLADPGSLSNVFFDVKGRASVALLRENGFAVACAQLVPCAVRREASDAAAGRPALWVQCLCVAPHRRRTGAARELMRWIETEAAAAADASDAAAAEVWLAVQEANAPARALYEGLGFAGDAGAGARLGHAVAEAGPAALLGLVALLGASALIAPFCYGGLGEPAPAAMVRDLAGSNALRDVGVGLVAAVGGEAARRAFTETDDETDPVAALERDPSLAAQKAALWRVTGAGAASPAVALGAIAVWQGAVAASEELYYRALYQNGLFHAVSSVSAPAAGDAVSLLATTALFAVSHAGYVDDVDASADVDRGELARQWLVDVAPFGLLLGLEFAATGHRLWAPVVTHATLNTYWSALDAAKLRGCGDRARLAELLGGNSP